MDSVFATALGELGVSIGIPALEPEADGTCLLGFDGNLVAIEEDRDAGRVVLTSHVADLPEADGGKAYAELLQANLASLVGGQGASFALDPDEGRILLAQSLSLDGLTGEALGQALGPFVNLVEAWRVRLEALRAMPAAAEQDRPDPPVNPAMFV